MCLAVPMRLTRVDGPVGVICSGEVTAEVRLDLVEGVTVGDWVLVHAGYAIARMGEQEAAETLALLAEVGALAAGAEDPV
jgi:hydrogenase expression/formation protein HypC